MIDFGFKWGLSTYFHGKKSILPNFSSLRGVATLDSEHHSQAGSTKLDLRKLSNGLFLETEKGFGIGPTPGGSQCTGVSPTLSLKESTLSG